MYPDVHHDSASNASDTISVPKAVYVSTPTSVTEAASVPKPVSAPEIISSPNPLLYCIEFNKYYQKRERFCKKIQKGNKKQG